VEKNKTAREDVFGEEDGTSTAGGRRVFLEVLELLQDPLRSHGWSSKIASDLRELREREQNSTKRTNDD
jgi:hypothetical protein